MEVKRQQHRTRTRGIDAASARELEDGLNIAMEELEGAGQDILSVQIFPLGDGAGAFTAFILYTDNVGLDVDYSQRHTERYEEKTRKARAQHQRVVERRAQLDAAPDAPPSTPVSTPGS
jgi:SAM-dependent methyltransferase